MVDLVKPPFQFMLDTAQEHGLVVTAYFNVKIQDVTVVLTTEEIVALRLALLFGIHSTQPEDRHAVLFKPERGFSMSDNEFGAEICYDRAGIVFTKGKRLRVKFRLIPKTVELVGTIGVCSLVNRLGRILVPDGSLDINPHELSPGTYNAFTRLSTGNIAVTGNTTLLWDEGAVWFPECPNIKLILNGGELAPHPSWINNLHTIEIDNKVQ